MPQSFAYLHTHIVFSTQTEHHRKNSFRRNCESFSKTTFAVQRAVHVGLSRRALLRSYQLLNDSRSFRAWLKSGAPLERRSGKGW